MGLILGNNTVEYPMWIMLRKYAPQARIEHVNVHNFTRVLRNRAPFRHFSPCAVIEITSLNEARLTFKTP